MRKIKAITLVLINMKIKGTFSVLFKMMIKMTLMSTMMTKRVLIIIWKVTKPFSITTFSYLMTIAFLRTV